MSANEARVTLKEHKTLTINLHSIEVFKKSADDYSYDLEVITAKNVEQYMPISKPIDWSTVDFKRFSLFNNQKVKAYDFRFERIIEQIK